MKEAFLSYVWQFQLFNNANLTDANGLAIQIINVGLLNKNAGPDFSNAKIKIGDTIWAGNVELHVNASDWKAHQHQKNKAYDNVILHVVFKNDAEIKRTDGSVITTIELKDKINQAVALKWQQFKESKTWVACTANIAEVDDFTWLQWKDRLLIERLETKTSTIQTTLKAQQNNWDIAFFIHLTKAFGAKINQLPFQQLAQSINPNLVQKHLHNPKQVYALFFGQAGFLQEDFTESYPSFLKTEYEFLKHKHGLQNLDKSIWKFSKIRPVNFPTIRIAQLATLWMQHSNLFSKIVAAPNLKTLVSLFKTELPNYWSTHYTFDKASVEKTKNVGSGFINSLIINTVVPMLFVYQKQSGQKTIIANSLELLEQVTVEKNSIIDNWKTIGIKATNAYDTQALLQLKNEYCTHLKCLSCAIGNKILRKTI